MKKIQWAVIYNSILEEEKENLVVTAQGRVYVGALLFRKDDHDEIKDIIDEVMLDEDTDNEAFLDAIVDMYLKHNKKNYDSTEDTIRHWFSVNGVGVKPLGKEHYSKLIKIGNRTFRYNYKHSLLEWYKESNDEVIASIGLRKENADEDLDYWAEKYNDDLDEELANEMKYL